MTVFLNCSDEPTKVVVGLVAEFLPSNTRQQLMLMLVNKTWFQGALSQNTMKPKPEMNWPFPALRERQSKKLRLSSTGSDEDVEKLVSNYPSPVHVSMERVRKLTNRGVQLLRGLPQLAILKIMHCRGITDEGLVNFGVCLSLTHLDVTSCSISDVGVQHMKRCFPNLKYLNVSGLSISDDSLKEMCALEYLEELCIESCAQITNKGVQHLVELNRLIHLDMSGIASISVEGFTLLGMMPCLKSLIARSCRGLCDHGIEHLAKLQNLSYLDISDCPKLGDNGIYHVGKLERLTTLVLKSCKGITDAGMKHLKTLQKLRLLNVSGCDSITNEGLLSISAVESLTSLNISMTEVNDEGISYLKHLKDLEALDLSRCDVSHDGVDALAGLPHLKSVVLMHGHSCRHCTHSGSEITFN